MPLSLTRRSLLMAALTGAPLAASPWAAFEDAASGEPGAVPQGALRTLRKDITLKTADGRQVRISIWRAWGPRRGVILFSHGALSAPEKYERVIGPWNAAGFEVMAPLHVDSTEHPEHAKYGMQDSWRARLLDMRALSAFTDVPAFIAAGHSYGGLVALTLGGVAAEVPPGLTGPLRDARAAAVVAFSPPGISPGLVTAAGYETLAVPAFIQTGDRDVPFGSKDGRWQVHLAAYEAAPAGEHYSLVLEGVDHYFGGLICNDDVPGPPQPAQLTMAVGLSTLFMDAYALRDAVAASLLNESLAVRGAATLSRK